MVRLLKLALLICFFQACGQDRIPLKDEELRLLPYKGNEVLIFKSNSGDYDTIKLKDFGLGYPDAPVRLKYYAQIASIHGYFSDPNPPGGKPRYLYGRLFEVIAANPERETMLGIFLKAKNAVFYGPDYITISKLNKLEEITLQVSQHLVKDVVIIQADTTSAQGQYFIQRKDFVTAVYWSKSEGIVKYEKRDGEVWTKDN